MRARMPAFLVVVASLVVSGASLAQGRVTTPELQQRAEKSAWSEASWRADLDVAADLARRTHPDAPAKLEKLQGLQPERYLAFRRPEPEVARELTRLVKQGDVPAALLAELLVEGVEGYPFSTRERFVKRTAEEADRLMRMERTQLRAGLLIALGASAHPSAPFVTASLVVDERRSLEERRVAAVALGKTGHARALAVLKGLALDEKAPVDLRAAAFAGLGHVRTLDGVTTLAELSRRATDPVLQRAAALALGASASPWAIRGEAPGTADDLRSVASTALVDLLERADDRHVSGAVVDALGMVAHESVLPRLRALATGGRSTLAREGAVRAQQRLERVQRRSAR